MTPPDLLRALGIALAVLSVVLLGVTCMALVAGALWIATGWLATFIAGAGPLERAALAIGAMALVALVFSERERGR